MCACNLHASKKCRQQWKSSHNRQQRRQHRIFIYSIRGVRPLVTDCSSVNYVSFCIRNANAGMHTLHTHTHTRELFHWIKQWFLDSRVYMQFGGRGRQTIVVRRRRDVAKQFQSTKLMFFFRRHSSGHFERLISIYASRPLSVYQSNSSIHRNYFVYLRIYDGFVRAARSISTVHAHINTIARGCAPHNRQIETSKRNLNCGTMRQLICMLNANREFSIQLPTFP